MFKKFLIGAAIAGIMSAPSFAKTPPDVLASYKAYSAALKAKDFDAALDHAYAAWQLAEDQMGDDKTTANLAQNYAYVANKQDVDSKDVKKGLVARH